MDTKSNKLRSHEYTVLGQARLKLYRGIFWFQCFDANLTDVQHYVCLNEKLVFV